MKFAKNIILLAMLVGTIESQTYAMGSLGEAGQAMADIFFLANPTINATQELLNVIKTGRNLYLIPTLIKNGADVCCLDEDNNTPLHWAVLTNNTKAAEYLIKDSRIDVNAKNKNQESPLDIAIKYHKMGMAMILLAHPNIQDCDDTEVTISPKQKTCTIL